MKIQIQCLPHFEGLELPKYATPGSAGVDLRSAVSEPIHLEPMARAAVPTGLSMAIPTGFEGQVRPRSGLALRQGLTVINTPGTIDADYRGEIKVPMVNLGHEPVIIQRGMRIAQLIIAPVIQVTWEQVEVLSDTARGQGGFGHTGQT